MQYQTRHIRDRDGLMATLAAIENSGRPISHHEQRFIGHLRADLGRCQIIILTGERVSWLRNLSRRHDVEWHEGERLAKQETKRRGRAVR